MGCWFRFRWLTEINLNGYPDIVQYKLIPISDLFDFRIDFRFPTFCVLRIDSILNKMTIRILAPTEQ